MSGNLNILVVDDSVTVHKLMKKFLEPEGYNICGTAKNGKEALEIFSEENPDLTFLDITMPIMDGIETLREIKKKNPDAKVVMLSAMSDEEIVGEAESIGANRFLQKPFNRDILVETITEVTKGSDNT